MTLINDVDTIAFKYDMDQLIPMIDTLLLDTDWIIVVESYQLIKY